MYVKVGGELGTGAGDRLIKEIDGAISDAGHAVRAVILDCGELDYASNNGWHHILLLSQSLYNHNGRSMLHLALLRPSIQSVFADATFLGLLKIHWTMAEALAAARNLNGSARISELDDM